MVATERWSFWPFYRLKSVLGTFRLYGRCEEAGSSSESGAPHCLACHRQTARTEARKEGAAPAGVGQSMLTESAVVRESN